MLTNEAIQPQLNPNDFGFMVNLLRPIAQRFVNVHHQPLSSAKKAKVEYEIFENFLNQLQTQFKEDILITFITENWQKFMNDLESAYILEKLEYDEKLQNGELITPSHQKVQIFFQDLTILLGVALKKDLPASGIELINCLHERHLALLDAQKREDLKIKWMTLFSSKDLSHVSFEDLLHMIENLPEIAKENDALFLKAADFFFNRKLDVAHLTSKEIISCLKAQTNLKTVPTLKHHLLLRQLLDWNDFFSKLKENKPPNPEKLKGMIEKWPDFIENLLDSSISASSNLAKTSSHFFKTAKKIFASKNIPLTTEELKATLHQRILRIESEVNRKVYLQALKQANKKFN